MIKVFKSKFFRQTLTEEEQTKLTADFKRYKSGEAVPDLFGRDELYDHMNTLSSIKSEEVRHIHLLSDDKTFNFHAVQFSKTSDKHLVYCQGFTSPDSYLLMAVLSPSAHEKARDRNVMLNLAKMAENFRNKY